MKLSPFAFGTLLTGIGVLILSPDAALIKYIGLDSFHLSFWRGAGLALVMFIALAVGFRGQVWAQLAGVFIPAGILIAILFSTTTMGFVLGAERGDAAYTVVAVAATPLFAALWSWVLYREPADRPTVIAMIIGFMAVCLGGFEVLGEGKGELIGFLGASYIPIAMGLGFTLTRYLPEGQSPWAVYVFAGLITVVLGLILGGAPTLPSPDKTWVLAFSTLVVGAGSFVLISIGPRYISAAQTSLMLLLETALSPLWVFWLVKEAPGPLTLIAGMILILTLIGQTLAQLRRNAPPAEA